MTEPAFALSVFRLTPALPAGLASTESLARLNALNRAYYAKLNARPDIYLTQTQLNGTFCIRFAIGAARTTLAHIDRAWAILQEEAEGALAEWTTKAEA